MSLCKIFRARLPQCDISTAEADSGMCWESKDQKFHTKKELVVCSATIDSKSNELQKTWKFYQKRHFFGQIFQSYDSLTEY